MSRGKGGVAEGVRLPLGEKDRGTKRIFVQGKIQKLYLLKNHKLIIRKILEYRGFNSGCPATRRC